MKNAFNGLMGRLYMARERFSELEVNRNFQKWGKRQGGAGRENFNGTEYTKTMVHITRYKYNCSTRRKKKEKENIFKGILTEFSKVND